MWWPRSTGTVRGTRGQEFITARAATSRRETPVGARLDLHSQGGLVFQPVPDAPKPAATAVLRLLQMRDLIRDFAAEDNFRNGG